jgi:transcriptional regulator with XRE-family HTH domain
MQADIDLQQKLGARIRKLREERGWSQETFAHETGLARSFTSAIELGKKDIRLSTLRRLAEIFGISIAQILKKVG